jgi:hypothetical protein
MLAADREVADMDSKKRYRPIGVPRIDSMKSGTR